MNYTSDLPKSVQDEVLGEMMDQWAKLIPQAARIKKRRSLNPNEQVGVLVRFLKGNYSDSYRFDGNGGTIGHAVYPDPNTGKNQVTSMSYFSAPPEVKGATSRYFE